MTSQVTLTGARSPRRAISTGNDGPLLRQPVHSLGQTGEPVLSERPNTGVILQLQGSSAFLIDPTDAVDGQFFNHDLFRGQDILFPA